MAPPLLVVTPTKGHVGWDEPVRDPVVCLPHSGRSLGANLEPDQMTGMYENPACAALKATGQKPTNQGALENNRTRILTQCCRRRMYIDAKEAEIARHLN
ncbi:hypothetical protein CU661_13355 [Pseudomonas syringae pv. actinidifoliorum]|nr:hypothetical protein [Pseudomonas syringae pv. actinidifoliorum]